jgi:hypothetical protein
MNSNGRRFRPSAAMAVAFAALLVAMAGTAFSVGSKVPGKNGVKSSDIAPRNVKTGDLRDGAVTSPKLAAGSVTADKLATDAVTGGKIAANAVTGGKVANDSLTGGDIDYGSHVVTASNANGTDGAEASCPAGEIAVGGGADSADPADTLALLSSFPEPNTGQATRWQVFYESAANAGEITAYVICMPA